MIRVNQKWRWLYFFFGLLAFTGIAVAIYINNSLHHLTGHTGERIVIALPDLPETSPALIAFEKKYFHQNGVEVIVQSHRLGLHALESVIKGTADIAIAADIPFMFSVARGEKVAIFATLCKSRYELALIAPLDRHIVTPRDLVGKTVGTSFGTNMQYFLDAMLLANDVPEHKVKILNIPPADFASALQAGKVDAVTAFSPYKDEIQTIFGNQLTITFGEDLYVSRFNLIAKQEYLKRHPEIAHKVLTALNEAIQYMMNHPREAYKIIGKQLKLEAPQVAEILSTRDFNLILEQSLLLNLDEQTRWAIKKELVGIRSIPNYLDHIDYKPLLLVNPNGVEIIH